MGADLESWGVILGGGWKRETHLANTSPSCFHPWLFLSPSSPSRPFQDPHPFSCPQTPFCLGFLEAKEAERSVPWVGEQLQSKKLSSRLPH